MRFFANLIVQLAFSSYRAMDCIGVEKDAFKADRQQPVHQKAREVLHKEEKASTALFRSQSEVLNVA